MKIKSKYHHFLVIAAAVSTSGQLHALTTVGDTITPNDPGSTTITIAGNETVNGTLKVQPAIATTTTNTPTATGAGQTNPDAGSFGTPAPGSTTIVTVLGGVNGISTTNTGGGAEVKMNGDTTLKSATGSTTTGSYTRLTTVDVYNANQGVLAGTPVPGTQKYYAAYPDPANPGKYLPLGTSFATPALLDAFVAATPITAPVFTPLGLSPVALVANGGNLTVEGATSTQGIANNGKKITGLATGTALTDAANVGQVDAAVLVEKNRAIAAEGVLTTGLANEVTNRIADVNAEEARAIAAEGVLTTGLANEVTNRIADVDAEEARAIAAEGVLTTGLANEVTDRTNADISIRNDFTAADTRIRNDFTAADALERNARIAADDDIRRDYRAADSRLRSDIDQNTRGIAMVAAMTNTTVEAGKCHGLDFNVAQFQSETGMSFGYAHRINENLQIHAAAASTTDFDEAVGRIGLSYQW